MHDKSAPGSTSSSAVITRRLLALKSVDLLEIKSDQFAHAELSVCLHGNCPLGASSSSSVKDRILPPSLMCMVLVSITTCDALHYFMGGPLAHVGALADNL